MMNSLPMPLMGIEMKSLKTSKRAFNILGIKVVRGLELEVVEEMEGEMGGALIGNL